jgi:hypothetical protein
MPLTESESARIPNKISDVMCNHPSSHPQFATSALWSGYFAVQLWKECLFLSNFFDSFSCLLHLCIISWLKIDQNAFWLFFYNAVTQFTTFNFQPMVYEIMFPAYSEKKCILNILIITVCYWTTCARNNAALYLSSRMCYVRNCYPSSKCEMSVALKVMFITTTWLIRLLFRLTTHIYV